MDKVIQLNVEDMDVVVQPGVGWMDLNDYLKVNPLSAHQSRVLRDD